MLLSIILWISKKESLFSFKHISRLQTPPPLLNLTYPKLSINIHYNVFIKKKVSLWLGSDISDNAKKEGKRQSAVNYFTPKVQDFWNVEKKMNIDWVVQTFPLINLIYIRVYFDYHD